MKQNRRKARSPALKFWVAATETAAASRRSAPVTSLAATSAREVPACSSWSSSPRFSNTSSRQHSPGRDHSERCLPLARWKARNSSIRSRLSRPGERSRSSSHRLRRATCRSSFTADHGA